MRAGASGTVIRKSSAGVAACLAALAMAGGPTAVRAQGRYVPSVLAPKVKPTGILFKAADALGMVRGTAEDQFDTINRIQYHVEGAVFPTTKGGASPSLTMKAVISISYHQDASRIDETVTSADGKDVHRIEVVADGYAWNETKPGVGGVAAMASAKSREHEIWMTPHGFLFQAMKAGPDGVKIGKTKDGKTTLTVAIGGVPVTATLGEDMRPATIESKIVDPNLGPTTETWEYSGYKDFDFYAVQFPSHMTRKIGGRTNLDLTVTDYRSGPYFLFPKPDDVAKLASASK